MKDGFKILDSDMHLREPADLWDKYMEPEWHDRAPKILSSTARSSAMVMIEGKILQGYKPAYRGGIYDATRIDKEIAEYRAQGFDARTQLKAMDRTTAAPHLFDTDVTTKKVALGITASSSASAILSWAQTVPTFTGINGVVIDYRNASGGSLYWRLVRASDGAYYNYSASSWWLTAYNNALSVSSSNTITRYETGAITVTTGAATALTLSVGYPALSTNTASSGYIYHGELQTGGVYGHTRVATSSALVAALGDFFAIENHSTSKPLWSTDRGTLLFQYVPLAGSTDMTSDRYLLTCGLRTG